VERGDGRAQDLLNINADPRMRRSARVPIGSLTWFRIASMLTPDHHVQSFTRSQAMTGRRAVIGACVLSVMLSCAFAAQAASAAGTTAYTCKETKSAGFSDAHCTAASGSGPFGHVAFTDITVISGTNAKTSANTSGAEPSVFQGVISGIPLEIECTTVVTVENGFVQNSQIESEMVASGAVNHLSYSGCTVLKPAGQGCEVAGGSVVTEQLEGTTAGVGMALKVQAVSGGLLATITLEHCKTIVLNKSYPVTGSLLVTPNGATLATTLAGVTAQGTLIFGGQKAGLGGKFTLSGPGAPLTATT
jgi:hypothetical protein